MRVHNRERAKGVNPRMLQLLDKWEAEGTHEVCVAVHGGLRVDQAVQSALSAGGMSAATTLKRTPHGRGGALDVYPLSFLPFVPVANGGTARRWGAWDELPQQVRDEFKAFGVFAEKHGYKWGGRWVGHDYPNGDQPHCELIDWQKLPFPPPIYA